MVLGLRSKSRRPTSTQVDYTIHIQEIKPWPPSQSLKSLKSVLLQWENGPRNSGTTSTVTPSQTKIEFNESFNLHITLLNKGDGYQRNVLELSLYEPRRDKSLKGQILGNAVVDLAEYGVIKEIVRVGIPLICKRSYRNTSHPIVYFKIQALDKEKTSSSSSSFRDESLSKESVSALMSEEYLEEEEVEAEIASFTDDDVSSIEANSEEVRSSEDQHVHLKSELSSNNDNKESTNLTLEPMLYKPEMEQMTTEPDTSSARINDLPQSSPTKLSIDAESMDIGNTSLFKSSIDHDIQEEETVIHSKYGDIVDDQLEMLRTSSTSTESEHVTFAQENYENMQKVKSLEENTETESSGNNSPDNKSEMMASDRVKTARFPMSIKYENSDLYVEDVKEIDSLSRHKIKVPNKKVQELEGKIEILEKELREAAAMEISLYSIVAEHGSSMHKVHTPARRLSRLYIHDSSVESKASAARSIVSGLVLVAKACGNDVSRLTFWMSNSIVLRAIITRGVDKSETLKKVDAKLASNVSRLNAKGKSLPLKWESLASNKGASHLIEDFNDWEDHKTFTHALERIESWIFTRVIESLWWQTLTPHMHSSNEGSRSNKCSIKKNNLARQTSIGNYSTEIWKNAFNDACGRLCPVRAAGHECGCLSIIAKLVMEQCVARLDVAMFNAILRESGEDIPTDPVSDPISDATVLPIQPGELSFGAGAQLKNSIGNWSRWLTDLFGMDTDEYPQCNNQQDNESLVQTFKSFSLLHALSDLLMLPKDLLLEKSIRKEVCPTFCASMIKRILANFSPDEFCPDPIPEDVLEALDLEDLNKSSEEEIRDYPYDAAQISYFVPSVSSIENIIGDVRTTATLKRSTSSVIRKCHTSDDELDELDSPLASICIDNSYTQPSTPFSKLKGYNSAKYIRYQLLHDVWKIDD